MHIAKIKYTKTIDYELEVSFESEDEHQHFQEVMQDAEQLQDYLYELAMDDCSSYTDSSILSNITIQITKGADHE